MPNSPYFKHAQQVFRSEMGEQAAPGAMRAELDGIARAFDAVAARLGCGPDDVEVTRVVYSPKADRFDVEVEADGSACDVSALERALDAAAPGGQLKVPYGPDTRHIGCVFEVRDVS